MSIKRIIVVLAAVSIAIAANAFPLAPLINANSPNAIKDQYVVVFKAARPPDEIAKVEVQIKKGGGTILFVYCSIPAFAAARVSGSALDSIRSNGFVEFVEQDQQMTGASIAQSNPPLGIDRVDQRLLLPNGQYQYTETGQNVHAYVIDSGILATHQDFGGRVTGAFTAINDGHGTSDCNGHGTHVAGTIGGATYGIAKNVSLHSVRVFDCTNHGPLSGVIAGVDWVSCHKQSPAVVNMSLTGGGPMPSLDFAVRQSITRGITYVVSAGNFGRDACGYSPARIPAAITVGAVGPANDKRSVLSNYGSCVDLFAPGVGIDSDWITSNTDHAIKQGTSMAAAHVTGVAALVLQLNPNASPAQVWSTIHNNDDVYNTTPSWPGIINAGLNSPNELLHWGPLNDGYDDGDPHITTVDGTYYNFQAAGEFVLLQGGGVEIQTRQTPVATTFNPGADPYDGVASCVGLNTAVAARVGSHRVTYQPNISGVPDPSGMQLRIDGNLTPLTAQGIDLAGGGRVVQTAIGNGLEIQFPEETVLTATPAWWNDQGKWFLSLHVARTRATDGLMGAIAQGSWLPALPSGQSMGAMPSTVHQRFVDLNQTFANAWRVTAATSLFDYATGTSTATFTLSGWPAENGPCRLPRGTAAKPAEPAVAQNACRGVTGEKANANCVFDVIVTGEQAFANAYLVSQQLNNGATIITLGNDRNSSVVGHAVTFTASVALLTPRDVVPVGSVQFIVDGIRTGDPIRLDPNGRAAWTTTTLSPDAHRISAAYVPAPGTSFLPSSSAGRAQTVSRRVIDGTSVSPRN